jgi:pimeloyl-ACP methyl ester carboxylesterase
VPTPRYTPRMLTLRLIVSAIAVASLASAQDHVSFATQDGGLIYADVYGTGDRGVVLAHGGQFKKESWEKQARVLVANGFRVLAFDFRGFGQSRGPGQSDFDTAPFHLDVLAAVRYLRKSGAKTVSVVGGSFGGSHPEKFKVPKLLIIARDDANDDGLRLPKIRAEWEKVPEPKELIVLDGSAHAQFLFQTNQADRVMREILRFLSNR